MKIIFYSNKNNKLAKSIAYQYLNLKKSVEDVFLLSETDHKKNLSVLGVSEAGHKVVVLGCYQQKKIIFNLIAGINNIFSIREKIVLVDTDVVDNLFLKLGKVAMKLNFKNLGIILIKKGIYKENQIINKIIKRTKERVRKD